MTHSYYGSLDETVKPKKPLGYMLLDAKFKDIIKKNEKELIKRQESMLADLKRQMNKNILNCKKVIAQLEARVHKITKLINDHEKGKTNGKKTKKHEPVMAIPSR